MQAYINSFQEAFDIKGEVGRLVDAATCETLVGPDWQLNMQIVGKINSGLEGGAKDAARTLRKRLKHKCPRVAKNALTLTETLVSNCGMEMRAQIATKEFMDEMKSIILNPTGDTELHRRAVEAVQNWGEGFRQNIQNGDAELRLFVDTVVQLKAQGVRFPTYDPSEAPSYSNGPPHGSVVAEREMNLEPGLPQYHQQQQQQQQQLPSQDDRRVTHRQTATERLHAQAQAYHSAPMWQQQQQQQTLDSDQRPAPQSAFNSELLSQDLEQVSVETALLCDVLDASTLNSERDPGQESMCNELARNLGIYNTRMVKLMEEIADDEFLVKVLSVNEEVVRVLDVFKSRRPALGTEPHLLASHNLPAAVATDNLSFDDAGRHDDGRGASANVPAEGVLLPELLDDFDGVAVAASGSNNDEVKHRKLDAGGDVPVPALDPPPKAGGARKKDE